MKAFAKPPQACIDLLEAIQILLGEKSAKNRGWKNS